MSEINAALRLHPDEAAPAAEKKRKRTSAAQEKTQAEPVLQTVSFVQESGGLEGNAQFAAEFAEWNRLHRGIKIESRSITFFDKPKESEPLTKIVLMYRDRRIHQKATPDEKKRFEDCKKKRQRERKKTVRKSSGPKEKEAEPPQLLSNPLWPYFSDEEFKVMTATKKSAAVNAPTAGAANKKPGSEAGNRFWALVRSCFTW